MCSLQLAGVPSITHVVLQPPSLVEDVLDVRFDAFVVPLTALPFPATAAAVLGDARACGVVVRVEVEVGVEVLVNVEVEVEVLVAVVVTDDVVVSVVVNDVVKVVVCVDVVCVDVVVEHPRL
jgi:hypothetical protein